MGYIMNKKSVMFGLVITISTLLLKASDIIDYVADYVKSQNWRHADQWDMHKIRDLIAHKAGESRLKKQQLLSSLSETLSPEKKRLLISSFNTIATTNQSHKNLPTRISDPEFFKLKKEKEYVQNLLFLPIKQRP
jgi:hypothetical protein